MNEPNLEKTNYELSDLQKKEIDGLIKDEFRIVNWQRLNITKIEDLEFFLKALKNYLFQTESIKKLIVEEGNINIIMKISKKINDFKEKQEPKLYFILFKAIFELYSSSFNKEFIKNYTETIIDFIHTCNNKDEIVLANFVDLFEVLIYLKVNQMNESEMVKLKNNLDKLLKSSLEPKKIKNNDLDSFFALINSKIKSQQYVIFDLLLDYIKKISSIISGSNKNLDLYIYHGILKPIFQLQMNKNTSINAQKCYDDEKEGINKRIDMNKNFSDYYSENKENKKNKDLMNEIFQISIEESYPKNNKRNNSAWELFTIFIVNWTPELGKPEQNNKEKNTDIKTEIDKSNTQNKPKINNTSIKKNEENIPYYLFPEVVSLIIKMYEYENMEIKDNFLDRIIYLMRGTTDDITILIKEKVLNAMKNKKIGKKEKLAKWLEYLLKIYSNKNKVLSAIYKKFVIDYVNDIPTGDINVFIKFEELLLKIGGVRLLSYRLQQLIDKIINSENIINNKQIYKSIQKTLKNDKGVFTIFKAFKEALDKIQIDIYNLKLKKTESKNNEKDENNKNEEKKNQEDKVKNILIFAENMVYELTELLLEDKNLSSFRKSFFQKADAQLFPKLYSIWAIEPLSVLILCIATERYELAFNIILNLKDIEFNDDIFKKLAKLVESFEKYDYEFFRNKLLSPSKNIFFIKTLFGILMILPQGVAFDFLNEKLSNVQTLLLVEDELDEITKNNTENNKEIEENIKNFLKYQQIKKSYKIEN